MNILNDFRLAVKVGLLHLQSSPTFGPLFGTVLPNLTGEFRVSSGLVNVIAIELIGQPDTNRLSLAGLLLS